MEFRYTPMEDIDRSLIERWSQYPRVDDITWDVARTLARYTTLLFVRAQFRVRRHGAIPKGDRIAYVSNHQSHLDTLALLAALPERERKGLAVLAAKDYFFSNWAHSFIASCFAMAVAFDRMNSGELRRWARLLAAQQAGRLVAYPSGSRKRLEPHPGLLFILARSGWQIIPVRIEGTAAAWPVGARFWRPFRTLDVTFGPPLVASDARALSGALTHFWLTGVSTDAVGETAATTVKEGGDA